MHHTAFAALLLSASVGLAGPAAAASFSTQASTAFDSLSAGCFQSSASDASVCGAGNASFHTNAADGYASSEASAAGGVLHARADVQATNANELYSPTPTIFFEENAAAIVHWSDRLVFTNPSQFAGVSTGIVTLTFTVTGSASGGGSGTASLDMPSVGSPFPHGCSLTTVPGSCVASANVAFAAGAPFELSLTANARTVFDTSLANPVTGIVPPGTQLTSIADFGHTAYVSAVQITDLSGRPLALDYGSESGAVFPSVPEPSTVGLEMIAGVVGITARRSRSRA